MIYLIFEIIMIVFFQAWILPILKSLYHPDMRLNRICTACIVNVMNRLIFVMSQGFILLLQIM